MDRVMKWFVAWFIWQSRNKHGQQPPQYDMINILRGATPNECEEINNRHRYYYEYVDTKMGKQ